MLFKKLLRTAWSYKSQFISMIIMLSLGIGVFLGFNIEWHSIETDTSEFFKATSYADFRIYFEAGFDSSDTEKIKAINGVEAATRYLTVNAGIDNSEKSVTLNVSEDYSVSTMLITSGAQYSAETDGIWLSDRFAEVNGISLGDSLTLTYKGVEISGKAVGFCKSSENMICVADSNQLMPDYNTHGFAYISPKMLEKALGAVFYPQISIKSELTKTELENKIETALEKNIQVTEKELHIAYAGAESEAEEGKTMGSVLPVLFLAIAALTMVTTMHRIASNEKLQIGTLKALGFRDRRILIHYTSYGLFIGALGAALGIALGYGIAALIISPGGMMSTYFDLPDWKLTMPSFCVPVIILTLLFLTLISYFSARKMLKGTAAEALMPYTPRAMRKSRMESSKIWERLPFSAKWNIRDIMRHKARSGMTLLGVFGCMLLIVGGLGMRDTISEFIRSLDITNNYSSKLTVSEAADNKSASALCRSLNGDWQATSGISYNGEAAVLDIYSAENGNIRFLNEKNELMPLGSDGAYLCLRLKNTASIGDIIEISPYGSDKTYKVAVAGYFRSPMSESIIMTADCAEGLDADYRITYIYTDKATGEIDSSALISGKQDKNTVMESYNTFLELLNLMIAILIAAAIVLGIAVLYNLGIMSYVERRRELATLKVLGFRDKKIGLLLINQNMLLTLVGVIIGAPGGAGVLYILIKLLCSEYELKLASSGFSYAASILLTAGVSLIVGIAVARKNKKINMVEALKATE